MTDFICLWYFAKITVKMLRLVLLLHQINLNRNDNSSQSCVDPIHSRNDGRHIPRVSFAREKPDTERPLVLLPPMNVYHIFIKVSKVYSLASNILKSDIHEILIN